MSEREITQIISEIDTLRSLKSDYIVKYLGKKLDKKK